MPQLEVLICTIDEGIRTACRHLPPPQEGVAFLISWQQTEHCRVAEDEIPQRPDVRVVTLKGSGLSANRNHALQQARGDLLLIADDDVRYRPEHFRRIVAAFERYPQADLLTFQLNDFSGKPIKPYPADTCLYGQLPRGSYISSWEIALRRQTCRDLRFDLRFGLGAPFLGCGEEEVFVHEAFRQGRIVRYVPAVIGATNRGSTGTRFSEEARVRRAKGAVLYVFHGYWGALFRCFKLALLRILHRKPGFFKDMYDGIHYAQQTGK